MDDKDKIKNWYAPGPVKVHMMTDEERKEIEAHRKKRGGNRNKKVIAEYISDHKAAVRGRTIKSKK